MATSSYASQNKKMSSCPAARLPPCLLFPIFFSHDFGTQHASAGQTAAFAKFDSSSDLAAGVVAAAPGCTALSSGNSPKLRPKTSQTAAMSRSWADRPLGWWVVHRIKVVLNTCDDRPGAVADRERLVRLATTQEILAGRRGRRVGEEGRGKREEGFRGIQKGPVMVYYMQEQSRLPRKISWPLSPTSHARLLFPGGNPPSRRVPTALAPTLAGCLTVPMAQAYRSSIGTVGILGKIGSRRA